MEAETIVCNLGLGDAIVIAGAVVEIAERRGRVRFPTLPHNHASITSFFVNYPEIEVFIVDSDFELRTRYADSKLKCYWTRVEGVITDPTISWDKWMYQQLDVPFDARYFSSPLFDACCDVKQLSFGEPYRLIHDDPERGFAITNHGSSVEWLRDIPIVNNGASILQYVEAILYAHEIQVIDSSVWHLVETINFVTGKLFLHRYARKRLPIWHDCACRYKWEIVENG
jgi:hypothetical protein